MFPWCCDVSAAKDQSWNLCVTSKQTETNNFMLGINLMVNVTMIIKVLQILQENEAMLKQAHQFCSGTESAREL